MLEVFFDNEKVFSFFEAILKNESERVNCTKILYNLGVDEATGAEMLRAFVYLGILQETEDLYKGIFAFNPYSPVTLGLCFFDEFIGNYCLKKTISDKGEENNIISDRDLILSLLEKFDELKKENGS